MYLDCRGASSPTVVLVSGLKCSAADWDITEKPANGLRRDPAIVGDLGAAAPMNPGVTP